MRLGSLFLVIVCFSFVSGVVADEEAAPERPQSSAALGALREYERVSKAADDVYRQAEAAADRKLIEKLKPAMTAATRAGNLADANAIESQIKAANERNRRRRHPAQITGARHGHQSDVERRRTRG